MQAFTLISFPERQNASKRRAFYGEPDTDKFWIYFIQSEDGPIKIGKTEGRVTSRVSTLQPCCPAKLSILAAFQVNSLLYDRCLEGWIHEALKDHRIRGEWFKPVQRVLDYAFLAKAGQYEAIIGMVTPERLR